MPSGKSGKACCCDGSAVMMLAYDAWRPCAVCGPLTSRGVCGAVVFNLSSRLWSAAAFAAALSSKHRWEAISYIFLSIRSPGVFKGLRLESVVGSLIRSFTLINFIHDGTTRIKQLSGASTPVSQTCLGGVVVCFGIWSVGERDQSSAGGVMHFERQSGDMLSS